jgi:hypothetical protein
MKMALVLVGFLLVAVLYGWRFHPDAIGTKRPLITREASGNKVAQWNPAGFLDRFNGNKDFQREQSKIKADRAAIEAEKSGY